MQFDTRPRVEQAGDQRTHVIRAPRVLRQERAEIDVLESREVDLAGPTDQCSDPAYGVKRFPLGSADDVHQAAAPAVWVRPTQTEHVDVFTGDGSHDVRTGHEHAPGWAEHDDV